MFNNISQTLHKRLDFFLDIFLLRRSSEHDFVDVVFFYNAGDIEIHHLVVQDVTDRKNHFAAWQGVGESDILRPSIDTEDSFGLAVICLHNFIIETIK
jgi:hypothetical protein